MNPAVRPTPPVLSFGRLAAACLLAALSAAALSGGEPDKRPDQPPQPAAPAGVEVHFNDGSVLKVLPHDERLEVATPYGKLTIPLADVHQIDFGTRIPDSMAKRIDQAIADLGDTDFHKRETASAELLRFREKAYPALLEAAKQKDAEVVRRVEGLLERLRETVPEKDLEFRKHDVVQTADSKIAGHVVGEAFKVQTTQFGEVEVKLADVRSVRSLAVAAETVAAKDVLQDPGTLGNYTNNIGQTYRFRVTGALNVGTVWGTGVYTSDSALATVAVHAGLLKVGQTGVIKVTIVPAQAAYMGSTQNGVTTNDYGEWPGAYRVSR
jgi:hypothetical protein